jgi:hypothetical protein
MPGKKLPSQHRLATSAQLWVLNRAGRLKLVQDDELDPIRSAEADGAIKRSMGAASESLRATRATHRTAIARGEDLEDAGGNADGDGALARGLEGAG